MFIYLLSNLGMGGGSSSPTPGFSGPYVDPDAATLAFVLSPDPGRAEHDADLAALVFVLNPDPGRAEHDADLASGLIL